MGCTASSHAGTSQAVASAHPASFAAPCLTGTASPATVVSPSSAKKFADKPPLNVRPAPRRPGSMSATSSSEHASPPSEGVRALLGHTSRVQSVALSPCGRVLVTAGDDCTIRVWPVVPPDLPGSAPLSDAEAFAAMPSSASFPVGSKVNTCAFVPLDGPWRSNGVWADAKVLDPFMAGSPPARSRPPSPSASSTGQSRLDAFHHHGSFALSKSSRRSLPQSGGFLLVTACDNGLVELWDLAWPNSPTGPALARIATLFGHQSWVAGVVALPSPNFPAHSLFNSTPLSSSQSLHGPSSAPSSAAFLHGSGIRGPSDLEGIGTFPEADRGAESFFVDLEDTQPSAQEDVDPVLAAVSGVIAAEETDDSRAAQTPLESVHALDDGRRPSGPALGSLADSLEASSPYSARPRGNSGGRPPRQSFSSRGALVIGGATPPSATPPPSTQRHGGVSNSGIRLVAVGGDKVANTWVWKGSRTVMRPAAVTALHNHWVLSVTGVHGTDDYAVSGSWDRTCRIWKVSTGEEICVMRGHQGGVTSVCTLPSGGHLLSHAPSRLKPLHRPPGGGGRGGIRPGARRTGAGRRSPALASVSPVVAGTEFHLPNSPDNVSPTASAPRQHAGTSPLMAPSSSGTGFGPSAAPSPLGPTASIPPAEYSATYDSPAPHAKPSAAGGSPSPSFSHSPSPSHPSHAGVASLDLPAGLVVVSGSEDRTIRMWDRTGLCLGVLHGHTDVVTSICASHNGRWVFSGSNDATVRVWSAARKSLVKTLHVPDGRRVLSVAVSADSSLIACGTSGAAVYLFSLAFLATMDSEVFPASS